MRFLLVLFLFISGCSIKNNQAGAGGGGGGNGSWQGTNDKPTACNLSACGVWKPAADFQFGAKIQKMWALYSNQVRGTITCTDPHGSSVTVGVSSRPSVTAATIPVFDN